MKSQFSHLEHASLLLPTNRILPDAEKGSIVFGRLWQKLKFRPEITVIISKWSICFVLLNQFLIQPRRSCIVNIHSVASYLSPVWVKSPSLFHSSYSLLLKNHLNLTEAGYASTWSEKGESPVYLVIIILLHI